QRHPLQQRQPGVAGGVDDRGGKHRPVQIRLAYRLLRGRLCAVKARAVVCGSVECREEHEPSHARALCGPHDAPGGDPVELLDRAVRLIANRRRQVHDRVHPPQRIAKRRRIGEVAERDLHAHAQRPQPARVAHQAAHVHPVIHEPAQQRRAHLPGGSGEEQHRPNLAESSKGEMTRFRARWLILQSSTIRLATMSLARWTPSLKWTSPEDTANPTGKKRMAYVIAEPCIGTKDNSCVEVCPVDCIHPTPEEPGYDAAEMLYIDPEECIDCDACVEACPVDACFAEDQLPEEWQKYSQINAEYFANSR